MAHFYDENYLQSQAPLPTQVPHVNPHQARRSASASDTAPAHRRSASSSCVDGVPIANVQLPDVSLEVAPLLVPEQTQTQVSHHIRQHREQSKSPRPERGTDKEVTVDANKGIAYDVNDVAVLPNFPRWRSETFQGRYLPRYIRRIPKDQDDILRSDTSWQPPLVGQPYALGTVPIELLNQLTHSADNISEKAKCLNVTNIRSEVDVNESQAPEITQSQTEANVTKAAGLVLVEPNSEEDPVSRSQWPSSPCDGDQEQAESSSMEASPVPMARLRTMPPDSSDSEHFEEDSVATEAELEESADRDTTKLMEEPRPVLVDLSSPPPEMTEETLAQEGTSSEYTSTHASREELMLPPSTAVPPNIATHILGRTVQVKRTPLVLKDVNSVKTRAFSSIAKTRNRTQGLHNAATLTSVPGTYDESNGYPHGNTARDSRGPLRMCRSQQHPSQRSGQQRTRPSRPSPQTESPIQQRLPSAADCTLEHTDRAQNFRVIVDDTMLQSAEVVLNTGYAVSSDSSDHELPAQAAFTEPQAAPEHVQVARKRKAVSIVDDHDESKRPKDRKATREVHQDYADIDARRRVDRGEFYRSLRQSKAPAQSTTSNLSSSTSSVHKDSLADIRSEIAMSEESPNMKTSDTSLSFHQQTSSRETDGQHVPRKPSVIVVASSSISGAGWESPQELFEQFKKAYPSYAGQKKAFDKACGILRQLKPQKRALHQSLWDDFIFRYQAEYLLFLRQIVEEHGNAVSYEQYYEDFVDEPKHLSRIVKAPSLGIAVLNTSTTFSPNQARATLVSKLDQSVAAESSVSNVMPQRHPLSSFDNEGQTTGEAFPKQNPEQAFRNDEGHGKNAAHDVTDSQESVHQWLEKAAGAASPELGTPVADKAEREIPVISLSASVAERTQPDAVPDLTSVSSHRVKRTPTAIPQKRLGSNPSPAATKKNVRPSGAVAWWNDDSAPFKIWARHFSSLTGEIAFPHKGRGSAQRRPQAHSTIDIFSWRK